MSERSIETKTTINIPELLAPVGGVEQLRAAVCNGADAVYLGGSIFNARMKADNFAGDGLKRAIDYAHERGTKAYITLNTLIKDDELAKAFEYACELYEAGADALILQDMGLSRLIHRHIPDFAMHLSTQGTVYNTQALDLVKDFGFKRVVPARELSLEEIKEMCRFAKSSGIEIEVFVHGALCMGYSGQCQMSRLLGGGSGRSANRGLCAQPCRLPYTDENGETFCALSPKDLCTIEELPGLIEAGVDSLKIEGRLKSPEYVATVTRIYRKYLDKYRNDYAPDRNLSSFAMEEFQIKESDTSKKSQTEKLEIAATDRRELLQIFNRGGFTSGYLNGNPGEGLLSGQSPKNQGILVGRVRGIKPVRGAEQGNGTNQARDAKQNKGAKGFSKVKYLKQRDSDDRFLIDVEFLGNCREEIGLSLGDGVEVISSRKQGFPNIGNIVTYCETISGSTIRIGDFKLGKRKLELGDMVFKVTDKSLKDKAMESCRKLEFKTALDMKFAGRIGEKAELTVAIHEKFGAKGIPAKTKCTVSSSKIIEKASNRPTDHARICEQLMKFGGTPFDAAPVTEIDVDAEAMIPISMVNAMRREAVERLLQIRREIRREHIGRRKISEALREIEVADSSGIVGVVDNIPGIADKTLVPIEMYMNGLRENTIPYVFNISRGNLDKYIEENFDEIVRVVKTVGIVLGNISWIKQFAASGVKVYGDYGLNVCNKQAMLAFAEIGVDMLCSSDELSDNALHRGMSSKDNYVAPARVPKELEQIPLMITEHPIASHYLTDRKGVKHTIIKWCSNDKYLIF